jgi:hypothetical protein
VIERGCRLGFLDEATLAVRICYLLGRKNLQGGKAVEVRVTGFVDHAHPAFAKLFCDLVMAECSADHGSAFSLLINCPRHVQQLGEIGAIIDWNGSSAIAGNAGLFWQSATAWLQSSVAEGRMQQGWERCHSSGDPPFRLTSHSARIENSRIPRQTRHQYRFEYQRYLIRGSVPNSSADAQAATQFMCVGELLMMVDAMATN